MKEPVKKLLFILASTICVLIACTSPVPSGNKPDASALSGTWELNHIEGTGIVFDSLYSGKKPTISFDQATMKAGGQTSCNHFSGPFNIDGNKISFSEPMTMTKMFCPGEGENTFLATLKKVNTWSMSDTNTLVLLQDDHVLMRFVKK